MWPFLQTTSNTCGCEQSDYNQCGCNKTSSNDISYNGPALVCTEIALCDSLTVALQKIETKICSAGTVSGSGTTNYLARWTPDGNTLGIGLVQDNGFTTSINTALDNSWLFKMTTSSKRFTQRVENTYASSIPGNNSIGLSAFATGVNTGGSNLAINAYATNSAVSNVAVTGKTAGTSILNLGGYFEAINGTTNVGARLYAANGTNDYAIQLQDNTQGIGKFLKSITNDGHANWANITTADITGFPSSIVGGSGTQDYVARWTPNGTTLGTGVIRDNNTSVGINTAPDSAFRLVIAGNTLNGLYIDTNKISSGSNTAFGINSTSSGTGSIGENVGVYGVAVNNTNVNYGVYGGSTSPTTGKNIGLRGLAGSGAAGTYAIQLQDGTQAAGKFLKSITNNGEANWANITSSDTTGATGTFTSQDGKTITVTNGLITSII